MLELAVLGLLESGPQHGYELKKQLTELVGPTGGFSFGSLYPALRRLEETGAIAGSDTARVRIHTHPTGSLDGEAAMARRVRESETRRARKTYRITDRGAQIFAELLTEMNNAGDERNFAIRMAFASRLNLNQRVGLFDARAEVLRGEIKDLENAPQSERYINELNMHRLDAAQQELNWVTGLAAREQKGRQK